MSLKILQTMAKHLKLIVTEYNLEKGKYAVYDPFLTMPRFIGSSAQMHAYMIGRSNEQENVYRMQHNALPVLLTELENSITDAQIGGMVYLEMLGIGFELAKCNFFEAKCSANIIMQMYGHLISKEQSDILEKIIAKIEILEGSSNNGKN